MEPGMPRTQGHMVGVEDSRLKGWHMCRASFIRRLEHCKVTAASAMHGLCVS